MNETPRHPMDAIREEAKAKHKKAEADWRRGGQTNGENSSFNPIIAKPYTYRDPRCIPPRQFLHAGHYIRGFLSATIAPGGLGKTSLQLAEAMGMAAGRDLLKGITSPRRLKVWYWNLEDPQDEIDRRIAAILCTTRSALWR